MRHFDRTVYWLKKLRPKADDALLIAAIGHDIERAFRKKDEAFNNKNTRFTDKAALKIHQEKSAKIIRDFLEENEIDEKLILRVEHLISKHEVGGDDDQNILMDADSISFLENQTTTFLKKIESKGADQVKEKVDWMYSRISSDKARIIGKPFYDKMLNELGLTNSTV